MELFGAVKDAVTTRQAAEFYGIDVKSNGMARCIFHNDHSPSMKLDKRYHCFGCHADGDVINFVAGLFGLGNKEAAEKIANDFGISYEKWKPPGKPPSGREKQKKQNNRNNQKNQINRIRQTRFKETEQKFYKILTEYYHLLKQWKEERAPKTPEEEWDEYFCEALKNLSEVEYVLDCFLEAGIEEKVDIIIDYGKKVKEYERRIKQYRSIETEGT